MPFRQHLSSARTALLIVFTFGAHQASGQGIPVKDPLVIAKCGTCHARDESGIMERVSWVRTTPEGWQEVFKRMVMVNGLALTPVEARSILRYLSAQHGLAPVEAKPIAYDVERRIQDEPLIPTQSIGDACARCHSFAKVLAWRRSPEEWKRFAAAHGSRYQVQTGEALEFLLKAAPLHTPDWESSISRGHTESLEGKWLVTASMPGHGKYVGEMEVEPLGDDEFNTRVNLTSVVDGSTIARSGRSAVYGGFAWRGRSKGVKPPAPDAAASDTSNEAREVLWIAPDRSFAEGRWFWGQYQELGFDVKLQRDRPEATLLSLDRSALGTGSKNNRLRFIGAHLPAKAVPADFDFGPEVAVTRILSQTPTEIAVEVGVTPNAKLGARDIAFRGSVLRGAIAIYDLIDYLKVVPQSSVASFADRTRKKGHQQFDAIAFHRGADGRAHTADDVDLGSVEVTWSLEVFYAPAGSNTDFVGKVDRNGLFTPATPGPDSNVDTWIVATAKSVMDRKNKPLVGKSYQVVTLPTYTFNGRRYIRDLNRWLDDGPASGK